MTRTVAVLIIVAVLISQGAPAQRVRFLRHPHIVQSTDRTYWELWVEPHTDNRRVYLIAVAEDGPIRQSYENLDGDKSRAVVRFDWWPLPSGEYQIQARLVSSTKEVARASVPLMVMGRY